MLLGAVCMPACLAQAAGADWKVYGEASFNDSPSECFYDFQSIVREPDDHALVWTKCMSRKELDGIDFENEYYGRILQRTVQRLLENYLPPIATIQGIDFDQIKAVTLYEETANNAIIRPRVMIFYEFDCAGRMERELSISDLQPNGQSSTRDEPRQWRHVASEGNIASLLRLLCPLR